MTVRGTRLAASSAAPSTQVRHAILADLADTCVSHRNRAVLVLWGLEWNFSVLLTYTDNMLGSCCDLALN